MEVRFRFLTGCLNECSKLTVFPGIIFGLVHSPVTQDLEDPVYGFLGWSISESRQDCGDLISGIVEAQIRWPLILYVDFSEGVHQEDSAFVFLSACSSNM